MGVDLAVALKAMEKPGLEFADARLEERSFLSVRVVNGEIRSLNDTRRSGVGVRARYRGAWGLAATTRTDAPALREAAAAALASAKAASRRAKSGRKWPWPTETRRVPADVKRRPENVDLATKVKLAMDVCKAQRVSDRVVNTNATYGERSVRTELVNTAGARLAWEEVRTLIAATAHAAEAGRREFSYDVRDGTAGYELMEGLDPASFGAAVGEEAVALLSAKSPPTGTTTLIADPEMSGLLAHEVIGHPSEGDEVVKGRTFLTGMVGRRIGSPLVNLVDDGTYPGAHGSSPFDSEGSPTAKTYLIRKGVYVGHLHSAETAGSLRARSTGNGRAQDFTRRVWVRMTNTYFEPGDMRSEELIEETREGLLTRKGLSGMEDPVGAGFQCVSLMGYRVRKGEVGPLVRSITVSGDARQTLRTVDMASREFALSGGSCGKGEEDYVPVSSGGPYLRLRALVGGG